MKIKTVFSRFLMPRVFVSVYYFLKYRCVVSPKAEVDLTSNLVVGAGSRIGSYAKIKATEGGVRIGRRVDISVGCFLGGMSSGLTIGDDCLIGPNCTLLSSNYNYSDISKTFREQGHNSKGTRLGNNVLVGAGSIIMDGSDIGDDVIISVGSVVSGKVPSRSIVQGNPAKVVFTLR